MPPKEINTVEAARRLNLRLDYLLLLLRSGKIPARKLDGRWLVDTKAVEERRKRLSAIGKRRRMVQRCEIRQ